MSDSTVIGAMVASMLEARDGLKVSSAVLACRDVKLAL
jgi:hypothetical protein